MSKFKSATTIAMSLMMLGMFNPANAQFCNTCSSGTCSPPGVTITGSNQISSGIPVAYGSSLGTSYGYDATYVGGYQPTSSIPMTYDSNTYSMGSSIPMAGSTVVLNSTYASPNFEQYGSSYLPSTAVSNISAPSSYAYESSVAYPTTYAGGISIDSSYVAPSFTDVAPALTDPAPISSDVIQSSVMPTSSYAGTYTSFQPSSSTFQPTTSSSPMTFSGTYASSSSSYSTPVSTLASSYGAGSGMAQQKAYQAANIGLMGHVGGGLDGCKYEGVGWSNVSPDHAISKCCYWGQRPVSQIGVARGQNGMWYACVLYQ